MRQPKRLHLLSSDQVCSPHPHLNMRTVRPFCGLSIFKTSAGFSPQWLHAGIGLGSNLEKTSFLNSSFINSLPSQSRVTKLQSEHLFPKNSSALRLGMERFVIRIPHEGSLTPPRPVRVGTYCIRKCDAKDGPIPAHRAPSPYGLGIWGNDADLFL